MNYTSAGTIVTCRIRADGNRDCIGVCEGGKQCEHSAKEGVLWLSLLAAAPHMEVVPLPSKTGQ